ncbi:N-formylglutamate amidohydrolase [Deinococcus sp.]|uniref:N-formylglutamate amidohydrolase n=1 Tax=Deinococcus sp. TaxID=47478 RepID=UPI0025BA6457|nr:N-formylglutamate amidohydrolase [Deinococcus sp.]
MSTVTREQLLIVTPHSSGAVPADLLREMLGDDLFNTSRREALLQRIFIDGDPYTDLMYAVPGARFLAASWSRFAVDLNRERGDLDDNGVIKLTDFDRKPLYPAGYTLSTEAREARLRRIWDSFDAQIKRELSGSKLMIVGHCMAPQGPKLGHDTGTPRPAICLMPGTPEAPTFPQHLWPALQQACERAFAEVIARSAYQEVRIGVPWFTDTLSAAHHRHSGIPAFGIEFNAGLYLDGDQPRDSEIQALAGAFEQFADEALGLV